MREFYKVLLIGASGRGKTYSFRNMNRETTCFLNIERKPLPFKGGFKLYDKPTNPHVVLERIQQAASRPEIDAIVVDSFSAWVEMMMAEARRIKTGYEIYSYYNEYIGKFHEVVKSVNKEVFVTAHYEVITDELGGQRERRAKVKGKEWEGVIEKEYTIVLYTEAKVELGADKAKHTFTLYSDGTTSAKTPPDIFGPDIISIDNDCNLVLQKIKEFTA